MTRSFFVGIGAQKCASTWLYDILADHPEVVLSDPKELDFFSYHYNRGYQWYEGHWTIREGIRAFGEISPSYFCEPSVPERLGLYTPECRILLSLRDPVERAISNHLHEVRLGHFRGADLSFEKGMENNPMYLEQSRYGKHLQNWLKVFDKDQLLVIFTDDIQIDRLAVARRVQAFLGIDTTHESVSLGKRSNEGHVHRSEILERSRKSARRLVGRLGLDSVWSRLQSLGLQAAYRKLNRRPPSELIPPISDETKRRVRQLLSDDIRILQDITGRSLATWLPDQHR